MVLQTLYGGELGTLLRGSLSYSSLWFQNNGSHEFAVTVCEDLAQDLVKSGVQSELASDIRAWECMGCLYGRKMLAKELVEASGSFRMPVNRSRGIWVAHIEYRLLRDSPARCIHYYL